MNTLRFVKNSKIVKICVASFVMAVLLLASVLIGVSAGQSAYAGVEPTVTHHIIFYGADNSIFYETDVEDGQTPVCTAIPTKPSDTYFQFEFQNWIYNGTVGIQPATSDAEYIPMFMASASEWTLSISNSNENAVYGELVTLAADFGCTLNDQMVCTYAWSKDNKVLSYTTSSIQICDVTESGKYTLTVNYNSLQNPNKTATASLDVVIKPLEVAVEWSSDTVVTYNGKLNTPEATANTIRIFKDGNGYINYDSAYVLPLIMEGGTDVIPRDYIAKAKTDSANYTLTNNEKVYRIAPMEVFVIWGPREIEYNGLVQCRTASAKGANNENIELVIDGGGVEPGESYYVSAFTANENYKLLSTEADFIIIKRTVDVKWQTKDAYTYSGENQIEDIAAVFEDGTGALRRLKVELDTLDVNDAGSFVNAGRYNATASLPENYKDYYTLSAASELSRAVIMNKAEPTLIITSTTLHYVFDGEPKTVSAKVSSGEELTYTVNGKVVNNSFVQAGKYDIKVFADETDNYLAVSGAEVTLIIDVVEKDATSGIKGRIDNTEGISPTSVFSLVDATETYAAVFEPKWSDELIQVIDISLTDDGNAIALQGSSTVKIAVPDALKDEPTVYINYTVSSTENKFATVEVKDGFITLTLNELGQVAFYQSSVSATNSVTNMGSTSNVSGVIWWCTLAGIILITIIAVTWYFASRSKRIG